QRAHELEEQARLSRAGLPDESDDLPAALAGELPARPQQAHLQLAPDDERHPPREGERVRIAAPDGERRVDGRARRLIGTQLEMTLQEWRRRRRHADDARSGLLEEAVEHREQRGALRFIDDDGAPDVTDGRLLRIDD